MKTTTQRVAALTAIALLALPLLAFAQADNESAEGSCNDEMSEGTGCGSAGSGTSNSYTAPSPSYSTNTQYTPTYSTYTPSYNYNTTGSYTPSSSYGSTYSYPSYSSYQSPTSYQTYSSPSYSNYGTVGSYTSSDSEANEGNCNDEMSEGTGCGSLGSNSSYGSYSYPSTQYQTQYQTSYPSYSSNYYTPTSYSNYGSNSYNPYATVSTYANTNSYATTGSNPQTYPYSHATPTGRYDAFGTPLCMWSDYPGTAMPCGTDPQQWIFDPYSGTWY